MSAEQILVIVFIVLFFGGIGAVFLFAAVQEIILWIKDIL